MYDDFDVIAVAAKRRWTYSGLCGNVFFFKFSASVK